MGLLFAHVRMRKNDVLMVKTLGYVGTLRRMPLESGALWSFEGEGASDQEDLNSVSSDDDVANITADNEVSPAPPVLNMEMDVAQSMPAIPNTEDLASKIIDGSL